jgi:hypothetical protein
MTHKITQKIVSYKVLTEENKSEVKTEEMQPLLESMH